MTINYKTERLPLNFIYLGMFLLVVGTWRVIVLDWFGIILLVIALLCLFIRSGIIIDSDNKRLKKYTGFFIIRTGKWEDISPFKELRIVSVKETQNMSVQSITRTDTRIIYKLFLLSPANSIELMAGAEDFVTKAASKISNQLHIKVLD